jgi:hypothetical protein
MFEDETETQITQVSRRKWNFKLNYNKSSFKYQKSYI